MIKLTHKTSIYLNKLSIFSVGILIGTVLLILLPEAFEILVITNFKINKFNIGFPILIGFLLMLVLDNVFNSGNKYLNNSEEGLTLSTNNKFKSILESFYSIINSPISLSLLIHGSIDGISLGSTFVSQNEALKLLLIFGIIIHKLPTSFSYGIILTKENKIQGKFLMLHLILFAISTPFFTLSTFSMLTLFHSDDNFDLIIGEVLLFSIGNFLYIILHLLNHIVLDSKDYTDNDNITTSINDIDQFNIDDVHNDVEGKNKRFNILILLSGLIIPIILTFIQE
ncbi:uncharacterized protein KGF55_005535 [Candida pseudojiufengensis]|uniref:uncharacterized protein n=1 Tax=Candida pseudojiufengensis TaxID=497109 RepID=UPI002224D28F|nr:uncharacterized protein KGF55_005535 [Candida pseudojiufengensis]KAI5959045.1 hypothetical protein KGF55_005535 [Candida pseudojiufengensis]